MDAMEAVERLEHLGTIYGPLKQKHVIKHVSSNNSDANFSTTTTDST